MTLTVAPTAHERNAEQFFAAGAAVQELPQNSITFLNMTGDITITWTEENRERILELVRQKMKDGYNFFTTKRVPLIGVTRKVRVSNKNIDGLESLVIPDAEFEKLVAGMDDKEVAEVFQQGHAGLAKRKAAGRAFDAMRRLDKAEDVVKEQSLAVRPISGG